MNTTTNATWTTDLGLQVRVVASTEDKGFALVTGEGGWTAMLPEDQLVRDRDLDNESHHGSAQPLES